MIATLILIGAVLAVVVLLLGIAEAEYLHPHGELHVQATSRTTLTSGEIIRTPDGRAGYVDGLASRASGDAATLKTSGVAKVKKSTSVCFLPGQEVWWDITNNQATYKIAGDFLVGICVDGTMVSAATTQVMVDLNVKGTYDIELGKTPFLHTTTKTAGSPTVDFMGAHSGILELNLDATNEAQCVDALSDQSIAVNGDFVVEAVVNVIAASNANADFVIGLANASHASNPDTIAESVLFSINGNSLNINAESDDGTTEVAATDTTKDYALGTEFFVQIYGRDHTDIQMFVNGVNVLTGSTFTIADATGPMKLLALFEKSGGADADEVNVRDFRGWVSKAA